jgi:hypothetical protein
MLAADVNVMAIIKAPVTAEELRAIAQPGDDLTHRDKNVLSQTLRRLRNQVCKNRLTRLRTEITPLPPPALKDISRRPEPSALPSHPAIPRYLLTYAFKFLRGCRPWSSTLLLTCARWRRLQLRLPPMRTLNTRNQYSNPDQSLPRLRALLR